LNKQSKLVLKVFLIQTSVIFIIFLIMRYVFNVSGESFCHDDGYSHIAQRFYNGEVSLTGKVLGPFLPFLFSVIFVFPDFLYPVIRLLITQFFTLGNLIFAYLIFFRVFKHSEGKIFKYVFYGLLFFVMNPMYLYFTLKSTPEVYITFFLMGIIYFTYKLINSFNIYYLFLCVIFYGLSIFIKPVLILIPIVFLLFHLFKKRFNIALIFLIINLFNLLFFYSFIKFTEVKSDKKSINYSNIDYAYITYTYLVKNIIQSKDFNTGTKAIEIYYDEGSHSFSKKKFKEFIEENEGKSFIERNTNFVIKEPVWFIVARILTPVFFFSLYSSTKATILFFILNLIILIPAYFGMKNMYKNEKEKELIAVILLSLTGYILLYFLTYSYVRYALPVISILSVFSSYVLYNLYLRKKFNR